LRRELCEVYEKPLSAVLIHMDATVLPRTLQLNPKCPLQLLPIALYGIVLAGIYLKLTYDMGRIQQGLTREEMLRTIAVNFHRPFKTSSTAADDGKYNMVFGYMALGYAHWLLRLLLIFVI
jgi:hypothetical protein